MVYEREYISESSVCVHTHTCRSFEFSFDTTIITFSHVNKVKKRQETERERLLSMITT